MHNNMNIVIDHSLLARFPDLLVGGFLVDELRVAAGSVDPAPLTLAANAALAARAITVDNLVQDPRIAKWRQAIRECGVSASQYRSSPEQLARRLLRGDAIKTPVPMVSAYCMISAKHLAPLGGYDVDRLPMREVVLREARPDSDRFDPLGARPEDMPLTPRVVVYGCGDDIMCWGFNHRDSAVTCLQSDTKTAVFIGEGAYTEQHAALRRALDELRELLLAQGARAGDVRLATRERPAVSIEV